MGFAYSKPNSWRAWDDEKDLAEGEVFFDHEPSEAELRKAFPDDFKNRERLQQIDTARMDLLKKVEATTGVKIPTNNDPATLISTLLEILLMSDDETKAKLVDHVKAFHRVDK